MAIESATAAAAFNGLLRSRRTLRRLADQPAGGAGQTGNTMRPKMASSQNTADKA